MTTLASSLSGGFKRPSVLPGFGITLGFAVAYLSIIVLLPLSALVLRPATLGISGFIDVLMDSRVLAALRLSFGAAFIAALINAFFGLIVSWILVRYDFPFKRVVDALVDLPFALPTAVAGIALATIYAPNGWVGSLLQPLGIEVAFTPLGVLLALIFIGLPFMVRTVQPVLEDFEREIEEAAASLGATRRQTVFRVMLPALL